MIFFHIVWVNRVTKYCIGYAHSGIEDSAQPSPAFPNQNLRESDKVGPEDCLSTGKPTV
jgi:hypothetical protein